MDTTHLIPEAARLINQASASNTAGEDEATCNHLEQLHNLLTDEIAGEPPKAPEKPEGLPLD